MMASRSSTKSSRAGSASRPSSRCCSERAVSVRRMRVSSTSALQAAAARLPGLDLGEQRAGLADPLDRRALLLEEQGEGGAERVGDRLGVAQDVPLRLELRLLAGAQLGGVDLGGLEAEEVDPLAAHAVVPREALQPLGEARVLLVGLGHPGEERRGLRAAAAVEHGALEVRLDQAQLVALAMDAQEIGGEVGEQPQRGRLIVDEDAVAAAAADLPAHQHLGALRLQPRLLQHRPPAVPLGLEDPGDRQRLGPGAHHLGAGPRPREQRERIDDDRLAGPGLARKHVEPRPELDGGFGQDGQVADVDLAQHVRKGGRLDSTGGHGMTISQDGESLSEENRARRACTSALGGWCVLPFESSPSIPLHSVEREVFLRKVCRIGALLVFAGLPSPLRGEGPGVRPRRAGRTNRQGDCTSRAPPGFVPSWRRRLVVASGLSPTS